MQRRLSAFRDLGVNDRGVQESAKKGALPVWMSEHEEDRLNFWRGGPHVVDWVSQPSGDVYAITPLPFAVEKPRWLKVPSGNGCDGNKLKSSRQDQVSEPTADCWLRWG